MVKKADPTAITIPRPNLLGMQLTLAGDQPIITHEWSAKAKQEILDKQQKKAKSQTKKEARNPEAEYLDAFFKIHLNGVKKLTLKNLYKDWVPGVPVINIKAAMVGACRMTELPMTQARVFFFVREDSQYGRLTPINSDEAVMREDMVRLPNGASDFRWRPEFRNWFIDVDITYNDDCISAEQVINLANLAGLGGLCELRPSKCNGGSYGTFHVATPPELKKLARRRNGH